MTSTSTQPSGGNWLSAEWLYDALMRHIDADLVSSALPLLFKKHVGESSVEREARMERYERSFALFDAAFAGFQSRLAGSVRSYRKQKMDSLRALEQQERTSELASLDGTFNGIDQ
jgi:hypothetical protein